MPDIGVGVKDLRLGDIKAIQAVEPRPRPAFAAALTAAANLAKPESTYRLVKLP